MSRTTKGLAAGKPSYEQWPRKREPAIPILPGAKRLTALTVQRLLQQPIEGTLSYSPGLSERYLDMCISGASYVTGDLQEMNGKQIATIHQMHVATLLQRHGIGERLFKNFVAEAKSLGAQELWSDSVSNAALRLRAKLFGRQAMSFYDADQPELGFLPVTYQQAIAINDRMAMAEGEPGQFPPGLGVYVNLEHVDLSSWPRPAEVTAEDLCLDTPD